MYLFAPTRRDVQSSVICILLITPSQLLQARIFGIFCSARQWSIFDVFPDEEDEEDGDGDDEGRNDQQDQSQITANITEITEYN